MKHPVKARLAWVTLYQETKNAGLVCRPCGISRPTLRKWWRRFQQHGESGFVDFSRRPHHAPRRKIGATEIAWISALRERRLGSRRRHSELLRNHAFRISRATIGKTRQRLKVAPLRGSRLPRKQRHRYERPIPGERVQMDTCQIAPGLYQYTALDDCTRVRVLALYPRRSAANSWLLLEKVLEEMQFPVQRLQTDRGKEFFADKFQEKLKEYGIKFRPIKPRSPHLNGKVERSQRTALAEFYATADVQDPHLSEKLAEWQDYYNEFRPHGSLGGKTPWERGWELAGQRPLTDEVEARYDATREHLRLQNYREDLSWQKLKRAL